MEYTKDELKESKRFEKTRDIIEALFDDEKTYRLDEAEEIIRNFLEGSV